MLNIGLGGRILDLDPIGFCPLRGKYGPGDVTRKRIVIMSKSNISKYKQIYYAS